MHRMYFNSFKTIHKEIALLMPFSTQETISWPYEWALPCAYTLEATQRWFLSAPSAIVGHSEMHTKGADVQSGKCSKFMTSLEPSYCMCYASPG